MATKLQQERADRAESRAAALFRAADAKFQASLDATKHIPLGQPILVGHHSEGRHRRDVARSDAAMRQAVDLHRAAKSAEWAAGNSGLAITSDDPEAIEALEDQIEALEWDVAKAKLVNKEYKAVGLEALELIEGRLRGEAESTLRHQPYLKKPFPTYWFSNRGANLRRLKGRLAELQAEAARPEAEAVQGNGFVVEEDRETCRVKLVFDGKPNAETRKTLKSEGWRWAPSVGAWQRLLNAAGRRSAARMVEVL